MVEGWWGEQEEEGGCAGDDVAAAAAAPCWPAGWLAVTNADSNRKGRRPVLGLVSAHGVVRKTAQLGEDGGWLVRRRWCCCLFDRPGSGYRILAVGNGSVAVAVVGVVLLITGRRPR